MNKTKRIAALLMAAAMTLPAFSCAHAGSETQNDSSNGSVAENSAADGTKSAAEDSMNAVFTDDSGMPNAELMIREVESDQNNEDAANVIVTTIRGDDGKTYVPKTDINGTTVTQADGKPETELYTGTTLATTYAEPTYTPAYKSYQAFWLDTSKKADFVFDGDLLVFNIEIKADAPDGVYPFQIYYTDIANYDAKDVPATTNVGYICVNAEEPQQELHDGPGLTLTPTVMSAKQGDTIKYIVKVSNNPGFCAFDLRMRYDDNAMTIKRAGAGGDFASKASLTAHTIE